jgi:hypothetical protein
LNFGGIKVSVDNYGKEKNNTWITVIYGGKQGLIN